MKKIKVLIKIIDIKVFKGLLKKIYNKLRQKSSESDSITKTVLSDSQRDEYFQDTSIKQQLMCVDPKKVTSSGRLDVIARYFLFRDIAYENESSVNKSLYCRTILARSGGIENKDFFSENEKHGMDQHLLEARKLCKSIKSNGFQKENYIPVANDFGLYNGAHRLAAAMALDEDVWIRVCGKQGIRDMDFEWFCNNGFTTSDKIQILRGFADLHNDCGIFILFGTTMDEWGYIQKYIKKYINIVGVVDLDFSKDYVAFENLIHDIYNDYDNESLIERKIELLKFSKLIIRVILVSDELKSNEDLFSTIRIVKMQLRELLSWDYAKEAYVTLHASDDKTEFIYLKQIVLSSNNLKHLGMRMRTNVRKEFITWINEFKEYTREHGISTDDTCIVGSSPLEVVGIRASTDIDIVVAPELRKVYGDGVTNLTPSLDIATRNYVRNNDSTLIKDEQLIYDENCHFMFMGCKFANIEFVYYRKASSNREKDIKDVKLINIFDDYYKHFDDKKILQNQISREIARRKKRNEL